MKIHIEFLTKFLRCFLLTSRFVLCPFAVGLGVFGSFSCFYPVRCSLYSWYLWMAYVINFIIFWHYDSKDDFYCSLFLPVILLLFFWNWNLHHDFSDVTLFILSDLHLNEREEKRKQRKQASFHVLLHFPRLLQQPDRTRDTTYFISCNFLFSYL